MNRVCFLSWTKLRSLNLVRFQSPPITSPKFQLIRFCSASSSSSSADVKNSNNFNSLSESDDLKPSSSHDDDVQENEEEALDSQPPPQRQTKESIADRLLRLSLQSPKEFVPTPNADVNRINRFAGAPFPDQKLRSSGRNPLAWGSRVNHDSHDEEDDFSPRERNNYGGGGYNRNENREVQNSYNRGRRNFDDGPSYSRPSGNNDRRPQRSFNEDEFEVDTTYNFDDGQTFSRRSPGNYNNRQQRSPRSYDDDDDDDEILAPPSRRPQPYGGGTFNRSSRHEDFDNDDDDEDESRKPTQFANSENRRAIRDAYTKRFPTGGSRREFHSYRTLETESLPDYLNNISPTKFDAHNSLFTNATNLHDHESNFS